MVEVIVNMLWIALSIALSVLAARFLWTKKKTRLTICAPLWSPLEIIHEGLKQNEKSVADKSTRTMHPTKQRTPSFSELFGDLSSTSDSESDVVSQEAIYFPFAGPTREQHNTEDTAIALACPLVTSYVVLDTGDPDVLVPQRPERTILPL